MQKTLTFTAAVILLVCASSGGGDIVPLNADGHGGSTNDTLIAAE